MEFSSVAGKITNLAMTLMVVSAPYATEAITCGQVAANVAPCIGYFRSGGAPPPACCSGVRSLNSAAKTTPDCQTACSSIKTITKSIPGINGGMFSSLPRKCAVNIGYPISLNMDCSKVK
ncbi:lipid-transfer protein [Ranunculus cassubicifolius]